MQNTPDSTRAPQPQRKKPDRVAQILLAIIFLLTFVAGWLAMALILALNGQPLPEPLASLGGFEGIGQRPPALSQRVSPQQTGPTPAASRLPTLPEVPAADLLPSDTPPPAQAAAAEGLCGSSGSLTVLFIGVDFAGGVWPEGADSVRVVKANFDTGKIAVVAFPRDLWVTTSGLAEQGIDATRLGPAYFYKREAAQGSQKQKTIAATTVVGQALYDNFGLASQHYFTMQMSNVAEMVDTLGGVEVIVPEAFTSDRGVIFAAGRQVLDGPRALEYVRTYEPGGDPQRLLRQNQFLWGLQHKSLDLALAANLPALIQQFEEVVVTDLSPKQMLALACLARETPVERIGLFRIDATLAQPRDIGEALPVLVPDQALVRQRLSEWLEEPVSSE